jgi:hypothetical protein
LDKAAAIGAQIQVKIVLSNDHYPVPEKVYIEGDISPFARTRLKQILTELGVTEENQIWT